MIRFHLTDDDINLGLHNTAHTVSQEIGYEYKEDLKDSLQIKIVIGYTCNLLFLHSPI